MKRWLLFCLVLAVAICTLVSPFLVNDDDENIKDLFCDNGSICEYAAGLLRNLDDGKKFYNLCEEFYSPQPIISFLAQHEKSPPVFS